MRLIGTRQALSQEDLNLPYLLFVLLLLLWFTVPPFISLFDPAAGMIDPGIWQLILLSLICFLLIIALCWWLIRQFWQHLGLPHIKDMVTQFRTLTSWQQQKLYWVSFVLLLFLAAAVLSAII